MRVLFCVFLLALSACTSKYILEEPEVKRELSLWEVLQHKEEGNNRLTYEDKWFRYDIVFEYVVNGKNDFVNTVIGQCPIEKADYTVVDKETNQVVRSMTLTQNPCNQCHKR